MIVVHRIPAIALALASLTVGFGAIDLLSPWLLHEGTQVTDVGYGTLAGIVIPVGLLAVRPQVAGAVLALALAGAATGEAAVFGAGAVVAAALACASRGRPLAFPLRISVRLGVLAAVAFVPACVYASELAANRRAGVPPADAHLGLQQWAAMSAAVLAAMFAAVLAAARTEVVPALSASAATLAWAAAALRYPHSPGSVNPAWAWGAGAWATAFALTALWEGRRQRLGYPSPSRDGSLEGCRSG
jgi:hypothetical protein